MLALTRCGARGNARVSQSGWGQYKRELLKAAQAEPGLAWSSGFVRWIPSTPPLQVTVWIAHIDHGSGQGKTLPLTATALET